MSNINPTHKTSIRTSRLTDANYQPQPNKISNSQKTTQYFQNVKSNQEDSSNHSKSTESEEEKDRCDYVPNYSDESELEEPSSEKKRNEKKKIGESFASKIIISDPEDSESSVEPKNRKINKRCKYC